MRPLEKPWDQDFQILLILTVAFNIIPQIGDIPNWILTVSILFLVWKSLHLYRGFPSPPRALLWAIAVGGAVGVFFENGTVLGPEPATSLLVFLIAAKLLETNRYQDAMFVVCASYFLLMTHLLNSQSLGTTVFMALDILLLTLLMYFIHTRDRRRGFRSLRPVLKIFAITVPVWVFLFFAFPRFSTGLMNFNRAPKAKTGLSDSLNPGTVSSLAESEDIAFRAEFPPDVHVANENLYWRAIELDTTDGFGWTADTNGHFARATNWNENDKTISYEVWLEPTGSRRLPVLEYSRSIKTLGRSMQNNPVLRAGGTTFESTSVILDRIHYGGISTVLQPGQSLSRVDEKRFVQLPEHLDPRVQKLANELSANHAETSATRLADNVLQWYTRHHFAYTLRPGALKTKTPTDQLAEFLFETHVGFCEHYAASFAILMRTMGIPARVVTGYQGGRVNSFGGYTIVRSLDAHAWAEVWQKTPGLTTGVWVRVDPTSVIAPLRLKLGGEFNRLDRALLQAGTSEEDLRNRLDNSGDFVSRGLLAWDLVQMRWNGFLLAYNLDFQQAVLEKIGVKEFSGIVLVCIVALGLAVFVLVFRLVLSRRDRPRDPILASWHKFVRQLETPEFRKIANEAPFTFAERAKKMWPAHAEEISSITKTYVELRYGVESENAPAEFAKNFFQSARRFSIKAKSP